MASCLEEEWKRLKLTKEEEEIIVCDEEDPSEKAKQVALCLLGKLNTTNYFNPGAMKMELKDIWKPSHAVVIKDLEKNLFVFQFFAQSDKNMC